MEPIKWCDNSKDHPGPFFSVYALIRPVGEGAHSRRRERKKMKSKILGRFCKGCVAKVDFHVKGSELLAGLDPASD